jgi:hypothetical protein
VAETVNTRWKEDDWVARVDGQAARVKGLVENQHDLPASSLAREHEMSREELDAFG